MPNIAFIPLYSQYENMGDTLIARELVRLVAPHVEQVRFATDGVPAFFSANITDGLPVGTIGSYQRKTEILKAVFSARKSGGRGYLFYLPGAKHGEISWNKFAKSCFKNLPFLLLVRLLGGRICHVGVSYDYLGARHRFLIRLQALLYHRHIVRDVRSQERLDGYRIRNNGVCPDLCFHVFPGTEPSPVSAAPANVCFSFRTDQYEDQEDDCLAVMCAAQARYPDAIFHLHSQVGRDKVPASRLAARFTAKTGASVHVTAETEDLSRAFAYYRGKDIILSNRLHALLFAASTGAAPLAGPLVSDNGKIRGIWTMLGLTSGVLEREKLADAGAINDWLATARPVTQKGAALGKDLEHIFAETFNDSATPLALRVAPTQF